MRHNALWRFCGAVLAASFVSACTSGLETKSSTCSAYDSTRRSTEYSARLVASDADNQYELQIQAVHPITMASPIQKISLNDGTHPEIRFLDDNCICGMQIDTVDVDCTHITTYSAIIPEQTLIAVKGKGLAMTFTLENGRIIAGPVVGADEIRKILQRQ